MLIKRSFSLAGHRTSVALEDAFWHALSAIAARAEINLSALVAQIDRTRAPETSLASALRVLALHEAYENAPLEKSTPDRARR